MKYTRLIGEDKRLTRELADILSQNSLSDMLAMFIANSSLLELCEREEKFISYFSSQCPAIRDVLEILRSTNYHENMRKARQMSSLALLNFQSEKAAEKTLKQIDTLLKEKYSKELFLARL